MEAAFAFTQESAWGRCLDHFLYQAGHAETTIISYRGILTHFFAGDTWDCPPKSPERYSREDVENFIYHHSKKPWNKSPDGIPKAATIGKRLATIGSFYRYAASFVPAGSSEPLLQRPLPTLGIRTERPEKSYLVLSYEEFARFMDTIPRDTLMGLRDRAACLLYFWTARRRSELFPLVWGRIEHAVIVEKDGTRRAGFVYHFRGKKRKSIDDVAELPAYAMEAMQRYLEADGRFGHMQPEDPVFLSMGPPQGGGNIAQGERRALSAKGLATRVAIYAKQVGLHVSLHVFRHTAARSRYEAGSGVLEIQELLRHTSLDHTYRYLTSMTGTADPGARLLESRFSQFS